MPRDWDKKIQIAYWSAKSVDQKVIGIFSHEARAKSLNVPVDFEIWEAHCKNVSLS